MTGSNFPGYFPCHIHYPPTRLKGEEKAVPLNASWVVLFPGRGRSAPL
jgi:hypothetical protein